MIDCAYICHRGGHRLGCHRGGKITKGGHRGGSEIGEVTEGERSQRVVTGAGVTDGGGVTEGERSQRGGEVTDGERSQRGIVGHNFR